MQGGGDRLCRWEQHAIYGNMTESQGRIIKRYANRKLYDTLESRYVTLEQIAEMIRSSEDVKVIDNNTKEDLTSVTLAQILFEEEKKQRSFLPLSALRHIIQSGGQSLQGFMSQLSESAERVGRVFRTDPAERQLREKDRGREREKVPADELEPFDEEDKPAASERMDPSKLIREFMEGVQHAVDDWQKRLDDNIRTAVETISPLSPLQKEIQTLGERLSELEKKLAHLEVEQGNPGAHGNQRGVG
jgi:polyhydroxyalkanoate synthesis repressor PhaR